jgi:uncharacterized membrane protein YraQ (UPF0718 family)
MAGMTLTAGVLVFVLEGWRGVVDGFFLGMDTLRAAGLPFILGISLAGMIPIILSAQVVSRWMGEGAGFKGTLFGAAAGLLTPGGPYIMFPIAASLFKSGATAGPMAAYSAARHLIPTNRIIVWELPLLGATFPIARSIAAIPLIFVAAALVPVVLGIIMRARKKPE